MTAKRARDRGPTTASRVTVVAGGAYESLVLLYRQIQAEHGLPPPDIEAGLVVPTPLRPAADWFFRGDIALGMNVTVLAHTSGWHTVADLAAGLAETGADDLATAMLRPPDGTMADRQRRDREVAEVLAGASPQSLVTALAAERFDASAAAELLKDPTGAAEAFTRLISGYGRIVQAHEHALCEPLIAAADHAEQLLDEVGIHVAAERLFPQWKFHDLAGFDAVVLIPSQAIAPFLSARLTIDQQALIVFPVPPEGQPDLTALAAALKALADTQRLEILRIAMDAPITGRALARALGLTEATVHHHTSLLRSAGLLTSHRDANRVYHTARPDVLDQLLRNARRAVSSS